MEDRAISSFSPKFFAYIAHELGNPLHGMLLSAELIARYSTAHPGALKEIADLPELLKTEIKRLIALLEQLRSSRVLDRTNLQPTSLAAEIKQELAMQASYYEQLGIRIYQNVPVSLPCIMADQAKLRQVLLNLWKNAAEAMPGGGTLTVRSYANNDHVCLEVADSGEGIPAGEPVFEPEVTSKPGSNGLGLAIVREIVQQHNGKVWFESEPGRGTTFHIEFPIRAA
jgi:signal transduction histidine kinase